MPNPSSLDFADFYSKSDFDKTKNAASKEGVKHDVDLAHFESLKSAVGRYMTAMRDAGLLAPVDFAERRDHEWAGAWNRFVTRPADAKGPRDLAFMVTSVQRVLMLESMHQPENKKHDLWVEKMNAGRFAFSNYADTLDDCRITGKTLAIDMQAGWKPKLGEVDYALKEKAFTPLTHEAPRLSGKKSPSRPG